MSNKRVNIRAILADPVKRRRLEVAAIIATQAREGITTTQEQAEAAYDKVQKETAFAFCETAVASPYSPWHIRKLTRVGRKLGGGADTDALCGRKVSWDLETPVEAHNLTRVCCKTCKEVYESLGHEVRPE